MFLGKPIADAIGVPLINNLGTGEVGWTGAFGLAIVFILISAFSMLFAKKDKQVIVMEQEAQKELKQEVKESSGMPEAAKNKEVDPT